MNIPPKYIIVFQFKFQFLKNVIYSKDFLKILKSPKGSHSCPPCSPSLCSLWEHFECSACVDVSCDSDVSSDADRAGLQPTTIFSFDSFGAVATTTNNNTPHTRQRQQQNCSKILVAKSEILFVAKKTKISKNKKITKIRKKGEKTQAKQNKAQVRKDREFHNGSSRPRLSYFW